jgi:hypothetical protein
LPQRYAQKPKVFASFFKKKCFLAVDWSGTGINARHFAFLGRYQANVSSNAEELASTVEGVLVGADRW